jgi:hypothetical protein
VEVGGVLREQSAVGLEEALHEAAARLNVFGLDLRGLVIMKQQ